MPNRTPVSTSSTSGSLVPAVLQPDPNDGEALAVLSGTFTGAQGTIRGSLDGTNWVGLSAVNETSGGNVNGTLSAGSTPTAYWFKCGGWPYIEFNPTQVSTGTLVVTIKSAGSLGGAPPGTSSGGTLSSSTITSTSANALAVGPNGTTNPTFNVNAATGSAATGVSVTGAAAGSGVAEAVISSGTNESLTVDAKGTGTITLNSLGGTGAVQIGGGSSGNNATGLKVSPNAAASGVAIAAVSTGTNEKLTLDSKGSGTIIIGGTSTGIISVGRGSTSTSVFSSTKTSLSTQNTTPTAAQLLGGYISHASTTGAGTATLDTAADIDAAIPNVANGDAFDCVYSNTGTQTVTITTNTGLTLKGTVAIPSGKVGILNFFRQGTATWDVVCTVSG